MAKTKSIKDKTFNGVSNLIRVLPTGTVFMFQFLGPVLTNNGHCNTLHKYLTGILLSLCGVSCAFSCFTDSYTDSNGIVRYGIATIKGLYPHTDSGSVNLSSYKLRFGDFVHAFFAVIVFAALALLDTNTVGCFKPSFESNQKTLLMVLPPVIGAVSATVFMLFPNKRHGIGYSSTSTSTSTTTTTNSSSHN
ncbi:DUF679 domain-containing protein [Cephalotus follicularis]|uniref:DUF679 domain-containing protein n=1 Tax=Cephalotus follicularis TaxID=3775 RepID=A0A1Q3B6H0_CEPFO|nr:DUF679 domain-containing protein [Cephalotus follicularis]